MSGINSSDAFSSAAALPKTRTPRAQPPDEVLGMTVHSLPQPGADWAEEAVLDDAQAQQRTRRGRWKMLAVLLVCAAPVVASYFTYYVLRPTQLRSFGSLIAQQPSLPAVAAQTLDGRPMDLTALRGQWLLVSTSPAACDARCQDNLYLQRQLRESLGREKDRLDWVWLIADQQPVPDALLPALQQGVALRVPPAAIAGWLQAEPGHGLDEHLYVVDPQGNWMMRFPAGLDKANAGKAKRDLERLLRASASWDKAGRQGSQLALQ